MTDSPDTDELRRYNRAYFDVAKHGRLYLNTDESPATVRLCNTCKGAGAWDSCFDCGNRGYNPLVSRFAGDRPRLRRIK